MGYDGQFYYRLALDPLNWSRTAFGISIDTLSRVDRISFPALVWLVSAGQHGNVPAAMVIVNVVALGMLGGLCAAMARLAGRHPLWGLLLAGFWGFLWTLSRDLTELVEAVFVVAALLAVRKGRPLVAGLALTVAVIAREPALLVVAAVLVSRLWVVGHPRKAAGPVNEATTTVSNARAEPWSVSHTRLWAADAAFLLPPAVFTCWQLAVWARVGVVPVLLSSGYNTTWPFAGLVDGIAHQVDLLTSSGPLLALVELAVLAVMAIYAALSLKTTTAALHERIAWVGFAILALLLSKVIWMGDVGFRSLDDFYLFSGILLLHSRLRLGIVGLALAGTWSAVAWELVRAL
jgi:hypothetical protein